jgi:adenosyl cobinamide kinase/adenosyl cobinamide phosphate guanylyltransferase
VLTLLIGGARSGKSDLAVRMACQHERAHPGAVTFIATARPVDGDMESRIARHRADRPAWATIEEALDLDQAIEAVPDDHLAIVDCLTLWVSNAMLVGWTDELVDHHARAAASAAAKRPSPTVVVTNEVGLGVHPDSTLGLRYRELLGRVNRVWSAAADRALFLVAGRVLPLHDPSEYLP